MRRLTLLLSVLVLSACAGNNPNPAVTENPDVKVQQYALEDEDGPIACAMDAQCDEFVIIDACVRGAECLADTCQAMISESCMTGVGKDHTFTRADCSEDWDCDDDGNPCTDQKCNEFLFGGSCAYPAIMDPLETECGTGVCANSVLACNGWYENEEECVPLDNDSPETCNGLDDDCDGAVDDGMDPIAAFNIQGECSDNTQTCNGVSGYQPTMGNYEPVDETCNGLDDDCDGDVDEDFPDLGVGCMVGVGECAALGIYICNGDQTNIECNAIQGIPTDETCNGLDDDCDGDVDEGNPGGGEDCNTGSSGVCSEGMTVCTITGIICDQLYEGPLPESCNNLDDDCDGVVDNGFEGKGNTCDGNDEDLCQNGYLTCTADGTDLECTGDDNVVESCNDLDDDCDDAVDEGYEGEVDGACSSCYDQNYGPTLECGQTYHVTSGFTDSLNGYPKKPAYNENGKEKIFLFKSTTGGETVTVRAVNVLPILVKPIDLDYFLLKEECDAGANNGWGNTRLVFVAEVGVQYYVVIDEYENKGEDVTYDLEVTCVTP